MDADNHKRALQKCRAFLVQNISFEDDILWDVLQTNDVISNIQAENIKARMLSNSRQASAFLDHMLRRPRADYEKFKAALRECHQEHCAEMLESEEGPSRAPSAPQPSRPLYNRPSHVRGDAQGMEINEASTNLSGIQLQDYHPPASPKSMLNLKRKLKDIKDPQTQVQYSTLEQYAQTLEKEKCYPIKSAIRGRGIVLTMTGNRKGWEQDVLAVAKMFRYIEIEGDFRFDLKEEELISALKEFAGSPENQCVDCLFVVLMGHGGTWADGREFLKTADCRAFFWRDNIRKIFNNDVYPLLIDKPKIFLTQMCRGGTRDTGITRKDEYNQTQPDAINPDAKRVVPTFSDYIIGHASQPGTVANRDIEEGAWYIQELTKVVMEQAHYRQVASMLMEVNKKLEERAAKAKIAQLAESSLGLKAPLFLFPGVNPETGKKK